MTVSHAKSNDLVEVRPLVRQVLLCAAGGALLGAGLGAWLQGLDRVVPAAAIGLLVGSLCGVLDTFLSWALTWAVSRTQNRLAVGIAGATISAGVMGGFALVLLGAVGWIGNCWG